MENVFVIRGRSASAACKVGILKLNRVAMLIWKILLVYKVIPRKEKSA